MNDNCVLEFLVVILTIVVSRFIERVIKDVKNTIIINQTLTIHQATLGLFASQ